MLRAKRYIAFIIVKAEKPVSKQEIRDILPLDKLAKKDLELVKITVLEAN